MKSLIEKIGSFVMPDNGVLGFFVEIGWLIADILISFLWIGKSLNSNVILNQGNYYGSLGLSGLSVMIFIMLIIVPIFLLKENKLSGGNFNFSFGKKYGDQGSAKKGTTAEMKNLMGKDGLVLSRSVRLSATKSFEHIAIIGPTGSGKSSSFYIPNLLELDGSISAVVTDPKKEMYDICGPYLRSIGYKTIKLCPEELDNDYCYNPLLVGEDADQMDSLAQLILTNGGKAVEMSTGSSSGGAEWIAMATPLLAASFIFSRFASYQETDAKGNVKEDGLKIGINKTIYESIKFILSADLKQMEEVFKGHEGAYDKFLLFKTSGGSERTMSSIKTTLSSNVQLFTREKVKNFTRSPIVTDEKGKKRVNKELLYNPLILRKEPTVVFICIPETKAIDYMPLSSVLFTQTLDKCMGTKEGNPIIFLLDEFANIGVLPTIASISATARSRNISLAIGIQGMEQLEQNYGDKNAATILNNLKTKLVFSGLTGETARYISELTGVTTVETKNVSKNSGGQGNGFFGTTSESKSSMKRELYTPDEIRRMDDDSVLIIAHNKNPIMDKKNNWYTQKKYTDKKEENL